MAKPDTSKQIGIRIFPEQEAWLEAESTRRRVSVALIVREAISEKMLLEVVARTDSGSKKGALRARSR